jgi:hypothetical protein
MGWKEGQGVGARSTLKKKMKQRDKNPLAIKDGSQTNLLLANGNVKVENSTNAIVPFTSSAGYVYYVFVLMRIVKFFEKCAVLMRPFECFHDMYKMIRQ